MEYTELNPKGNFDSWDNDKLTELRKENLSGTIGIPLFENEIIIVSELILHPNERMPFRKSKYNYSATSLTDGLLISRNGNGKITMLRFKEGDVVYWKFNSASAIADLQNIGTTTIQGIIVAQKKKYSFCQE